MHGAEFVFGVLEFVVCFCVLCADFPDAFFFEGEGAPAVANNFGQRPMVGLYRPRDMFLPHEISTEEHERVGRAGDISH